MIITICSSCAFLDNALKVKQELESAGHEVLIYPSGGEIDGKYMRADEYNKVRHESHGIDELIKYKQPLVDLHFSKIEKSDAILVLNYDKNDIPGYIGGNTFLEMGLAYYLKKKIFMWQAASEQQKYWEEIISLGPITIEKDLSRIV